MAQLNEPDIIAQTRKWIFDMVIGLDFCPFAAKPFHAGRIRYRILGHEELQPLLEACVEETRTLDDQAEIETTLMILPPQSFEDYLDNLELCEALLSDMGYDGVYQLASFHPEFQFDGLEGDEPGNYTNRSPYPMLHFLRESSISNAVDHFPNVENIPEHNRRKTRELGLKSLNALRQACLAIHVRGSE